MFEFFKSRTTRRNEAWIHFHADVIRNSIQWVWAVEKTIHDAMDFQRLQYRLFSEMFAGYLAGFADVLVREIADDEPTRMKYSQMLFDCVLGERDGQWVRANMALYVETESPEFLAKFLTGFHAGRDDARDFTTSKEPKALTRLGKFFLQEKGLAA